MNIHHILFCCFLLSLQGRPVDALHFYRAPGEDLNMRCSFFHLTNGNGKQKIFCRENCEGENLWIKTNQTTTERGRYRTEYSENGFIDFNPGKPGLAVNVLNLTLSDTGLYRCSLDNSSVLFEVFVAEAVLNGREVQHFNKTAGSSLTVACSFKDSGKTKSLYRGEYENKILLEMNGDIAQSGRYHINNNKSKTSGDHMYVRINHLMESDSGRYRCCLDQTCREFNITVVNPSASVSSGTSDQQNPTCGGTYNFYVSLIIGGTLGIMVILLSAALLVSCRRRSLEGQRSRWNSQGSNMENVILETRAS